MKARVYVLRTSLCGIVVEQKVGNSIQVSWDSFLSHTRSAAMKLMPSVAYESRDSIRHILRFYSALNLLLFPWQANEIGLLQDV